MPRRRREEEEDDDEDDEDRVRIREIHDWLREAREKAGVKPSKKSRRGKRPDTQRTGSKGRKLKVRKQPEPKRNVRTFNPRRLFG